MGVTGQRVVDGADGVDGEEAVERTVDSLVGRALDEDVGAGDVTTARPSREAAGRAR